MIHMHNWLDKIGFRNTDTTLRHRHTKEQDWQHNKKLHEVHTYMSDEGKYPSHIVTHIYNATPNLH